MNNYVRIPKILKSARGKPCTMRLPGVCNHNPETTVWAHSNEGEDGKGMGIKAHDIFGAYMCSACHDEYDGRTHRLRGADQRILRNYFIRAMKESWLILIREGVLK